MNSICVVGSLNMDLVINVDNMPKLGQTVIGKNLKKVCGGKGANQAVAIARLGANVNMIGKVGDDDFGQSLINSLKQDKVNTDFVKIRKDIPTGLAFITVNKDADNSIIVSPGANYDLNEEDINDCIDAIKCSNIVVTQLEIPLKTVSYLLKVAKSLGKYTILNPAPATKLSDEIIKNVDLLTPNETELEILSEFQIRNEDDIVLAGRKLLKKGVKELVVTLGEKGSLYMNNNTIKRFKSFKVKAIDTTAAGDSFTGALAVALSNDNNIDKAIEFASKVGALTVTKCGAQSSLPYLEDVLNFKGE
ncbi:ribokinase [Alkalithermobacter thermoalcaliphilus JW-YL-7 = DSM 7308]|uniref:Ribokinase n=1 Tax=Alkalithermobacter thermoalcaliphilus JW-YL-7 = DSM 7308 TaxID=1121328 RepID=A0A150FQ66_CLOPD|nr:ribokinase [[Clostridium] paradoxum JW-YL-7 = DSM 7308]SHK63608.1 ribokinase [[Clostridium] paradoxum JW-YL-7 = DSM 7308]